MRASALHPDVVVVASAGLADDVHARRARRRTARRSSIDSPVLPDELEPLPALRRAGGLRRASGCSRRTATGTTCSAARVPGRARSAAPSRPPRGCGRAGRRPARAARLRRRALRRARAARCRSAERAGAAGARATAGSASASSSCTRPTATRPTAWRSGSPWASVLVCGDYLSPVEIPMALARRLARRLPGDARAARAARRAGGHGRARATARRSTRARAAAILREDVAYLEALRERGADAPLPLARRNGAQRRIHAENVGRVAGGRLTPARAQRARGHAARAGRQ